MPLSYHRWSNLHVISWVHCWVVPHHIYSNMNIYSNLNIYKYWENRFKIEENKSPTVRKLHAALRYETNFGQHTTLNFLLFLPTVLRLNYYPLCNVKWHFLTVNCSSFVWRRCTSSVKTPNKAVSWLSNLIDRIVRSPWSYSALRFQCHAIQKRSK